MECGVTPAESETCTHEGRRVTSQFRGRAFPQFVIDMVGLAPPAAGAVHSDIDTHTAEGMLGCPTPILRAEPGAPAGVTVIAPVRCMPDRVVSAVMTKAPGVLPALADSVSQTTSLAALQL
jgi:hypothetical protein